MGGRSPNIKKAPILQAPTGRCNITRGEAPGGVRIAECAADIERKTILKTNVVVDGIIIDVKSIYSIRHECLPDRCKNAKSCCASYQVSIDDQELGTITGWMPEAANFSPGLKSGAEFKNVFEEEDEENSFSLDTDNDGTCLFAYRNREDQTLCSLHSAALEAGALPAEVKPRSCTLWPLAVSDGRPTTLSIDAAAFTFICNTKSEEESDALCPEIAKIITDLFGEKFLAELTRRAGEGPVKGW